MGNRLLAGIEFTNGALDDSHSVCFALCGNWFATRVQLHQIFDEIRFRPSFYFKRITHIAHQLQSSRLWRRFYWDKTVDLIICMSDFTEIR